jgi:hypothetical protein
MGKSECSYTLSEMSYFCHLENPGHFESRTEFFRTPGQSSLKPTKSGLYRKTGMNGICSEDIQRSGGIGACVIDTDNRGM